MKKKIALLSAVALMALVSCSGNTVPSSGTVEGSAVSQQNDDETIDTAEENSKETDDNDSEASGTDNKDKKETNTEKDPDKYNTYSMDELYGEGSPLTGYWHTENKDMYIEYNEFGSEGFTVFILGKDMQIFSSQIGTFSGTPQNTEYILASSPEDEDVRNLYNKDTKLSMAVNDDNSISVFLDFGFGKTSTYTFTKGHPAADALMVYIGDWGNAGGIDLSCTYEDGKDEVNIQSVFGFSADNYPIAIPTVNDNNECWLCCPYKNGMLTTYSDQGVFYDVINVHLELNSDGSLNANREYTNPTLRNNSFLSSGSVIRKQS